tara:strand:- start:288 stop:809 length:522 start_codon:yes stop_codon:yes gene_type:complete
VLRFDRSEDATLVASSILRRENSFLLFVVKIIFLGAAIKLLTTAISLFLFAPAIQFLIKFNLSAFLWGDGGLFVVLVFAPIVESAAIMLIIEIFRFNKALRIFATIIVVPCVAFLTHDGFVLSISAAMAFGLYALCYLHYRVQYNFIESIFCLSIMHFGSNLVAVVFSILLVN